MRPPLVHVALVHYQFEAIHPFLDANGRVRRLLITLQLCQRNILSDPLLYLSAYFEATRADHYAGLRGVSENGDGEGWVQYSLNGVARQSEDALSRAERLNQLLADWLTDCHLERAANNASCRRRNGMALKSTAAGCGPVGIPRTPPS